jgi:hypothetical protein
MVEALEVVSALVAEVARRIEALGECLLDALKEGWNFIERVDRYGLNGIEKKKAALVGWIEACGLEQDRIWMSGNEGVQLRRKLMPSGQAVSMDAAQALLIILRQTLLFADLCTRRVANGVE